jgi:TP901 family phage tail tape measure protein
MANNQNALGITVFGVDEASKVFKQVESSIIRLVGAVASLTAAVGVIGFPIAKAIEFEKAMVLVGKTTGYTSQSLDLLANSLREMSRATGIAATDLASIAEIAGQLGVASQGREAVEAFTETVARFSSVAELSVEEAATTIAKTSNLFDIPITQAERLASVYNRLSDTTVATAAEIADVTRRVGSAGGLLGIVETAALAAQALELGQTTEVSGTAIAKTFANMATKAEAFAKVMRISTKEWVSRLDTDALQTLRDVQLRISEMDRVARSTAIKELFGEGRQAAFAERTIEDAANGGKILTRSLEDAAAAYLLGNSAQIEFDRQALSTSRQVEILTAKFVDLAVAAGQKFLPAIADIVERLHAFADDPALSDRVNAIAENLLQASETFATLSVALVTILPDIEVLITALSLLFGAKIIKGLIGLARAFGTITTTVAATGVTTKTYVGIAARLGDILVKVYTKLDDILLALLKRFPALAPLLNGLRGALALIASVVTRVGAALGPWGVAIAVVIASVTALFASSTGFRNAVREFFGFPPGTASEANARLREELEKSKKLLSEYQEALVAIGDGMPEVVVPDLVAEGEGMSGLEGQVETAIINASRLQQILRGSEEQIRVYRLQWEGIVKEVESVRAEMAKLGEESAARTLTVNTLSGVDPLGNSTQIAALTADTVAADAAIESLSQKYATFSAAADAVQNKIQEAELRRAQAAEVLQRQIKGLATVLDDEQLLLLTRARQVDAARRLLSDASRGTAKVEAQDTGSVFGTATLSQFGEALLKAQQAERVIRELGPATDKALEGLSEAIGGPAVSAALALTEESWKTVTDLATRYRSEVDAGAQAARKSARDELSENVLRAAFFRAQLDSMDEFQIRVTSTQKSIKGLFDNINLSVRATILGAQKIVDELRRGVEERQIDLKVDLDLRAIEEDLERTLKRVQRTGIRVEERTELNRTLASDNALRVKQKALNDAVLRQQERYNKLLRDAELQTKAIQRVREEFGEGPSSAEEIETLDRMNNQAAALNTALKNGYDELTRLVQAASKGAGTLSEFSGDLSGSRFTISEAEIEAMGKLLVDMAAEAAPITTRLITAANNSAEANKAAVELFNSFATKADDATKSAATLADRLGISSTHLREMEASAKGFVQQFIAANEGWLGPANITAFNEMLQNLIKAGNTRSRLAEGLIPDKAEVEGLARLLNDLSATSGEGKETAQYKLALEPDPEVLDTALSRLLDKTYELRLKPKLTGDVGGILNAEGLATGGFVRGPGTGTSDSILARLSNGEYVMDAATVRKFGAGFFESLQAMSGARRLGLPAYASGGLVTGGRDIVDVVLRLPEGAARLSGSRDEVERLKRAVVALGRGGQR